MRSRPVLAALVAVLALGAISCDGGDEDLDPGEGIDQPETVEGAEQIARAGLIEPDVMPATWEDVGTAGTPEHGPRSEEVQALEAFALETPECETIVEGARDEAEALASSRGYVGPDDSLYGNRVYVYADNGEAARFYAMLSGDHMRDCLASGAFEAIKGRFEDIQSEVGIRDITGDVFVPEAPRAGDESTAFAFSASAEPPEDTPRPARVEFVVVRVGAAVTVHSFRWLDEVDPSLRREVVQISAAQLQDAQRAAGD